MAEKKKTMHEVYGEPNDKIGKHLCCDDCGCCINCGDCHCSKLRHLEKRNKLGRRKVE